MTYREILAVSVGILLCLHLLVRVVSKAVWWFVVKR
jgi:hypothetical protein